jgi:hypothetical protein
LERLEKLSHIENSIKLNKLNAVYDILTEEQTILRKRNKILKIADRHGWDTGKDYLDSPSADDKEDASDLRGAISRANRKRSTPKPYNRPDNQYGSVNRGSGSAEFNPRSFFRGFGQFSGAGFNCETSSVQTVGRCFTVSNKDMSPQRNRYSNSTNGTGRRRYSENSVKGKIPVTDVDTTVLVIWSVIRFWRTPFTISPRNCTT